LGVAVLRDLAALTPPALVCAAFLAGVIAFLRHEMRTPDKSAGEERPVDSQENKNPPDQPGDAASG
jgi:hypothetical protein